MRLDLLAGIPVFAVAMAKLSCFLSSLFILLPISCKQFPTKCKRVIQQRKALHLLGAKLRSPSAGCRSSVELRWRRAGGEPAGIATSYSGTFRAEKALIMPSRTQLNPPPGPAHILARKPRPGGIMTHRITST